jgi:hypothetical protein
MLKFLVFDENKPAAKWPLRNAYLLGSDNSAMRCDIRFDGDHGMILCEKREGGAASLALQQPVGDCGELTLQTCLLPERDEPYILSLELARHRLMVLYNKLEDWAMFELSPDHAVMKRVEAARRMFVEALCLQTTDPAGSDRIARDCLVVSVDGSEELALAHAELLLARRKASASLPRHPLGVGVAADQNSDRLRQGIVAAFDFINLPMNWKQLVPVEGEYRWAAIDNWVEWCSKHRLPITAGPLIAFDPAQLPDWLYIWEHDYDTVRDVIYEHVEKVVTRYRNVINGWNIVSGLHVNSHFAFTFDQLMDLTRMTTMLVKKIQPAAKAIIEMRQPFGEYYAHNQRSIPPLMYGDLIVQNAIQFDALGVKLLMGQAVSGQFTRDLMQVSNLLDAMAVFSKPIHLSIDVPSEPVTQMMLAAPEGGEPVDPNSGVWRKPWSALVQSRWMEAALQIAMSKPFVEAVAWSELMDHPEIELPLGGLIGEDMQLKTAFRRMVNFRRQTLGGNGHTSPKSAVAAAKVGGDESI